jgi:hypothetical protein
MGDLSTGKVVAKSVARARLEKFGTTQQLPHNNSSLDRNIARPGLFAISCRLER